MKTNWKEKRRSLTSKKVFPVKHLLSLFVNIHLFFLEQFVYVPIIVYKKTTFVTKTDLPTYQVEKVPEYKVD